jgi:hypothetical protein
MKQAQNMQYKQAESIIKMKAQGENWMKAKRDHRVSGHLDKMVLKLVRQGGWTARAVAKGKPRGTTRLKST